MHVYLFILQEQLDLLTIRLVDLLSFLLPYFWESQLYCHFSSSRFLSQGFRCEMYLLSRKVSKNVCYFCRGQNSLSSFAFRLKNTGERSFREPQTLVFESSSSRLLPCFCIWGSTYKNLEQQSSFEWDPQLSESNNSWLFTGSNWRMYSQPETATLRRFGHGGGSILSRKRFGKLCPHAVKATPLWRGLKPIRSCEVSNYASKKAIEKAGFISEHRRVKIRLSSWYGKRRVK